MPIPTRDLSTMYPVFLSYSHDDNINKSGFVSDLYPLLSQGLPSAVAEALLDPRRASVRRVSRLPVQPCFLDTRFLAANGDLRKELRKELQASFALMIFVGPGYLASEWCFKELEMFLELCRELALPMDVVKERITILPLNHRVFPQVKDLLTQKNLTEAIITTLFDGDGELAYPKDNSKAFRDGFSKIKQTIAARIVDAAISGEFGPQGPIVVPEPAPPSRPDVPGEENLRTPAYVMIESRGRPPEFDGDQLDEKTCWEEIYRSIVAQLPAHFAYDIRCEPMELEDIVHRGAVLQDYDGVIVLMGYRQKDSLRKQLRVIDERHLRALPARAIAYLIPPLADQSYGDFVWRTLRFRRDGAPRAMTVLDPIDLDRFIGEVADRATARIERQRVAANG